MSDQVITIGIDTGDTAGIVIAGWDAGARKAAWARAFQCDRASAADLLGWILSAYEPGVISAVQIEAFDSRPKPGGFAGTSPDRIRHQVTELETVARNWEVPVTVRAVSDVKQWATDSRLAEAGLSAVTGAAAMSKHARDAARHALYIAVHGCRQPDPLSRKRSAGGSSVPG